MRAVIVAGNGQHAAVRRGAGPIGMAQHVERSIDAGALAIPDAEHAIDRGAGKQANLLAAPHRGGGEVFIETGLEADVVLFEQRLGLPQRAVVSAERRAAIAGDEARGVQAGSAVARALHERQAHERLNP